MKTNHLMMALAVTFSVSIASAAFTAPARADDGNNKSLKEQIKDDAKKDAKK